MTLRGLRADIRRPIRSCYLTLVQIVMTMAWMRVVTEDLSGQIQETFRMQSD